MELARTYPGREERRHPRVPVDLQIGLRTGAKLRFLRARNLSMTGILLEGERDLPEGQVVVEVAFPEEPGPIRLAGEVVRRSEGTAVRFLDLGWGEILALARFVSPRL